MKTTTQEKSVAKEGMARRSFLKFAGAGVMAAGVVATAASCQKHGGVVGDPTSLNLGSGDIGILNFAYALEQLEAAFYVRVTSSFFNGATDAEKSLLNDIKDHEVAHREFFKAAIPAGSIIPDLTPNFSSIDFTNRTSVLNAAKAFEDLGVSAYNGAGYLIKDVNYLALAGKIVSVEARHAALIRELITANTFVTSDVVTIATTSLEISKKPTEVLAVANKFVSGLPLSITL
jgi:rubrerythrin